MYYVFFSGIEIATTGVIVWQAWKWVVPETELPGSLPGQVAATFHP